MDNVKVDPAISDMVRQINELCTPMRIYLVSEKSNMSGELTSFKLCVISDDSWEPSALEARLLINTESAVPCDFIVYRCSDWNEYAEDDCTFAYRVDNSGVLLYEQG